MKALILAAGAGSRMAPVTDSIPKGLVPVNGKPIVINQLENLYENGITDITVVAGYRANMLEAAVHDCHRDVKIVVSDAYMETGDMYSAYLAREMVAGDDLLLMSADVFMDDSVIGALLAFEGENALVTDIGFYQSDAMKVVEREGRVTRLSRDVSPEDALGASIELYRFSAEGSAAFFRACQAAIEDRGDRTSTCAAAINDILDEVPFAACPLNGRWFEINDGGDLAAAERIFADE